MAPNYIKIYLASILKRNWTATRVLSCVENALRSSSQADEVEYGDNLFRAIRVLRSPVEDKRTRWSGCEAFRKLFTRACGSTRFRRERIGAERPPLGEMRVAIRVRRHHWRGRMAMLSCGVGGRR